MLVHSEEGRGTRVVVTVAVTDVDEAAGASSAEPATGTGRVLLVDDAKDNQRLLAAVLTRAGYAVEFAGNGREAVAAVAAAGSAGFDLVLMDLQMPGQDGLSAIRELRQRGFDLPVVALTAHAFAEDRDECLAAGADDYQTKPIPSQRLLEVVARHVARRRR